MSGAGLPYHLRPHKVVDRRLFLDLLVRFERWRPLADYVYISMGAYPLEDHKLIHRLIGVRRLLSFDFDQAVVSRQIFNKPTEDCVCIKKASQELIAELDIVLEACNFADNSGLVVWLDFTEPSKIGEQIRQFEALLDKLRSGDVVRVTVNAHPHAIAELSAGDQRLRAEEKRKRQFEKLKGRIGDLLPSWAEAEHMTAADLPRVLAHAFGAAALRALPVSGQTIFSPLSIVRYADGQQMLTITGALVERNAEPKMLERIGIEAWPFASTNWTMIHHLVVPDLTVRERLVLERGISTKTASQLIAELGFDMASGLSLTEFLETYKKYYRFYPSLLSAEV